MHAKPTMLTNTKTFFYICIVLLFLHLFIYFKSYILFYLLFLFSTSFIWTF